MLEKTFSPTEVEPRISSVWAGAEAFKAGRADRQHAAPYTIVIPPPNVTGSLHMGHALNNTLQDILCRFERMRGKDVLWQVGTDHAGIATQMVVERKLAAEKKPDRRTLGREKFLEEVWAWKEESGGTIINQLKRLGASCDWSRERFTMDEGLSKAVVEIFVKLHEAGLIYKDKRLVNWDPKLLTAISDLEVVQIEKRGSFKWERGSKDAEGNDIPFNAAALNKLLDKDPSGHLYYFDYPLEDGSGVITVATTRPETMLGDTAIAVHPENERLKHLIGQNARLPLVGRLIPIIGDDYADPEKGTGAVKITPAHDFNDFEVGKRNQEKIGFWPLGILINILTAEAKIDVITDFEFAPTRIAADGTPLEWPTSDEVRALHGLDRYEGRKRIVSMMNDLGLLAKIEPTTHMVPHGDRSGVAIEPWLTEQWYVNVKPLAERALKAVRDGETRFIPSNWEKTYFEWLENIQPWCISRQLWWGHQIPVWYGPDVGVYETGHRRILGGTKAFIAHTESDAVELARRYYQSLDVSFDVNLVNDEYQATSSLSAWFSGDSNILSLYRDPDVLDTWFSSALWPYSTLGWPEQTPDLKKYYPTSVLVTGFDIIFFWVARMMMTGLFTMDEVPFKDIYIHALVRDEKGAKMSKSKGNVIDPLDLIDKYGADALRFTLAAMAGQGRDIKLATSRVEGYRNFSTKLWNAARFAEMNGCVRVAGFDPAHVTAKINLWVLGEASIAVQEITQQIEAYRFNDAANAAYRFVWGTYCDWFLELAKPIFMGEDEALKAETRATTAYVLDEILKLLHPFMPFITEELWTVTGEAGAARTHVLALEPWPQPQNLLNQAASDEINWLVDLVSSVRSVRSEMSVPAGAMVPLVLVGAGALTRQRVAAQVDTLKRLARLSSIDFAEAAPSGSARFVANEATAALPLEGIIDLDAERGRLSKEQAKLQDDIAKIDAKLTNEQFVSKAPPEIIEEQKERREAATSRLVKIDEALTALG